MRRFILNKRTIIRWKIYIDRAKMYIGYINFMMLGIVFLKSYDQTVWGKYFFEHYYYTFPLLIVVFLVFSLFVGYLDTKKGLREEEMRNASATNPVIKEILKQLADINHKLDQKKPED